MLTGLRKRNLAVFQKFHHEALEHVQQIGSLLRRQLGPDRDHLKSPSARDQSQHFGQRGRKCRCQCHVLEFTAFESERHCCWFTFLDL